MRCPYNGVGYKEKRDGIGHEAIRNSEPEMEKTGEMRANETRTVLSDSVKLLKSCHAVTFKSSCFMQLIAEPVTDVC